VAKGKNRIVEYIYILSGSVITALALNWFLVPNNIAAGGLSGFATVIHHVSGAPVGLVMLIFNIPLFFAGVKRFGGTFGAKTILGAVSLSIFIDVIAIYAHPLTGDRLLASVYGGLLSGVGLGITFRNGGTTGGSDIGARLLSDHFSLSTGQGLMIIDFVIIGVAGLTFGAEMALYALMTLFVTGKVLDFIQEGLGVGKAAFIISENAHVIAGKILTDMDRGATIFDAKGAYTGETKDVVLSVVSRAEISTLKELVKGVDPMAFVIIADVHEVLGEGFRSE
jgi:uncharacterized membrane-anchored protein YitT (DUF2179 family)